MAVFKKRKKKEKKNPCFVNNTIQEYLWFAFLNVVKLQLSEKLVYPKCFHILFRTISVSVLVFAIIIITLGIRKLKLLHI